MRISASVEYATRLMAHLAQLPAGEALNADTLSTQENIPRAYVDQILLRLRRAGLIESHRGAHGGYGLARPAYQISVAMVMRAVEGHVFEDTCQSYKSGDHQCNHLSACGIQPVWRKLFNLVEDFLDKMTLTDLLEAESIRPDRLFGVKARPPSGWRTGTAQRRAALRQACSGGCACEVHKGA